jgi:hypothetical protein
MKLRFLIASALGTGLVAGAADPAVGLPELTVYSTRVANQVPVGTFAMPVSALRYEPTVDIHPRNLAESQADVTIRGGVFENTGFQLGALTVGDPQTGHYLVELPIAPAMLLAPRVRTGAALTLGANNATAGAIEYGWRPIRTAGAASAAVGDDALRRAEIYQGATVPRAGGLRFGADMAVAHSESDGAVPFGEHRFDRVTGRVQLASTQAQTDVFAGYQAKFFGWPNLYTPFNSNETENLQTVLLGVNHRADLGGGDFVEAGAFYRRHKDDYAFNRFAPVGPVHPFQHTTRLRGAALAGRKAVGTGAINARAEVLSDSLQSTALTFGRYAARRVWRVALLPENTWTAAGGERTTLRAGAGFDDSNRGGSALSPVVELERTFAAAGLRRIYLSATELSQLPTYTALNSNPAAGLFRGNPHLGRQTTRNYEVGLAGTWGGWATEAAAFLRHDDALVDWTFRSGVTARTANAVDLEVAGLEVVVRRAWQRAELVLGYTGLTKDGEYRGAAVDASFYALNYAKHRLTAALTWRVTTQLELRFDNAARLQADNLLRVIGGDDALLSAASVIFRPAALRRVELGLHADNLWDSRFQDVPGVPATPRQLSVSVGVTW